MKRITMDNILMKLRQRICARRGAVQHQTRALYFVALKFAGLPDHHILTDYGTTDVCLIIDLVQVRLRRKVGRDGLGTFAAFRMLLAKIGAKICCCSQLASHASVGKIRR